MVVLTQKSEAIIRGARMLRTALGPAIAGFLDDPSIVEAGNVRSCVQPSFPISLGDQAFRWALG
jgi:hypothetical protein